MAAPQGGPQGVDAAPEGALPAARTWRDPFLLLALALALMAALPALAGPGIVATRAGGDSPFLVQRAHQLAAVLRAGIFPVRWMPDAAHGLGYPFFHYYAALPYYLAALLNLAGVGVLWGIKLTQALGFILAALATYRLAREMDVAPPGALLAAAAYTFAPFHLVNVYVRGDALSEFWAMALYPAILWALVRLSRGPTPARIAALAASYGLLVLCHNISALLFSPLVGVWLLAAALQRRRGAPPSRQPGCPHHASQGPSQTLGTTERGERLQGMDGGGRLLLAGGSALALGLLVSAWFWAPALRDKPLVQLHEQTTGYFHFAGHFRADDLVQWRVIHDYDITAERDPFSAGLLQVLVALPGLVVLGFALVRRRRMAQPGARLKDGRAEGLARWVHRSDAAIAIQGSPDRCVAETGGTGPQRAQPLPIDPSAAMAVLTAGVYTWLITPSSAWLWEHLPLLPYTQFPWRLLSIQALALALIAAYGPGALRGRGAALAALALSAAVAVAGMAGLRVDHLPLREGDITPDRLMFYETYSGNLGTTVRHEYLPRTMVPRPYTSARQLAGEAAPPLALSGVVRSARLIARGPVSQRWDLDLEGPSLLAFHLTAYPGWRATVDGIPHPVESVYGLGLVGLRLEGGRHTVYLAFGATRFWRAVEWASAAGLVILLGLALYPCRASRRYRLQALRIAGIVALVAVWLAVAPERRAVETREGPLVADWDRAPYLHAEPDGVRYGELTLRGYDYGAVLPMPGGMVPVTLIWEGQANGERVRLELVAATAHLFEPAPVWAVVEAPLTVPWTGLALHLPEDLPAGLYVPRLTIMAGDRTVAPRAVSGVSMGNIVLRPIHSLSLRQATGDEPVLGSFGPPEQPPVIALVGAEVRHTGEGLAEVTLRWRSERQAPLNYYLSLRLWRDDGTQVASRDLPPLLGGYPTSLWRPGTLITDRVLLPLPADAPPVAECRLEVVLYDRITLAAAGTVSVP